MALERYTKDQVQEYEKWVEDILEEGINRAQKDPTLSNLGRITYDWEREGELGSDKYQSEINVRLVSHEDSIDTYNVFTGSKPWYGELSDLEKNLSLDFKQTLNEWEKDYLKI